MLGDVTELFYYKGIIQGFNKRSGRSVLHHRTGLSTICTLIKTGSKILRISTEAKFQPFVDAQLSIGTHIVGVHGSRLKTEGF